MNNIPKNIYQVWLQGNISPHIKNNLVSMNPNYTYHFFNYEQCIHFLEKNTNSKIVDCFRDIKCLAHKCDLFRYCLLKKYGGVYIDVDLQINIPLDKIIELANTSNFITSVGAHSNIQFGECTNGFLMSSPNNNLFNELIQTIISIPNPSDYGFFVKDLFNKLNKPLIFTSYTNNDNFRYYLFKEIKIDNKYYITDSSNNIIINTNGHNYH